MAAAIRHAGNARTVVIQSFRQHDVAEWVRRCLNSVRRWAASRDYDYCFYGDEIRELCGPDYLARVGNNWRSITNLARLEATRLKLAEGYERVIWLDADVFVFDQAGFELETEAGYAFSREVYVVRNPDGSAHLVKTSLHNAGFLFTPRQTDLELFIHIIRHTVKTRVISSNFQVGILLISGLAETLAIPAMTSVAMFSSDVVTSIAEDDVKFLREFARYHGFRIQAANIGWGSKKQFSDACVMAAMDRLEMTSGDVVNSLLGDLG
jgi:hypothetical protein